MNIREKLALKDQIDARNDARWKEFFDAMGVHNALEIQARGIMGSLNILADHYHVPRNTLLEQLLGMLQAAEGYTPDWAKGGVISE